MAVDQYAITTLAALKAHLNITTSTDDALLEAAIDRATYAIEAYLDRKVVQRRIYEWTTANGYGQLVLKNPPVGHVHFAGYGALGCMTVSSAVSTDLSAVVTVAETRLTLVRVDSSGNETITQINFSNHKTASAIAAVINATTGFTASVASNCIAQRMNRIVGRDIRNAPLLLTYTDQSQQDISGDLERGILYVGRGYDDLDAHFPVGPLSMFVDYDGGFETVPPDIVLACLTLAAQYYNTRARDSSVQSESFGDYSYTLASPSASGSTMPAEVANLLSPWKRYR
jgi:hypothetical protein